MLKDLIEHGAVTHRVAAPGPRRRRSRISSCRPARSTWPARSPTSRAGEPIEMVTSVPDPSAQLDGEALDRERAVLAARAGLDDPGPGPEPRTPSPSPAAAGRRRPTEEPEMTGSEITSDRGALLRLFSGLRDQG